MAEKVSKLDPQKVAVILASNSPVVAGIELGNVVFAKVELAAFKRQAV